MFTIFTYGHGNGGHFYSLASTAKALASKCEVSIVNFGFGKSAVLENSGLKIINISNGNFGHLKTYRRFRKVIKEENPQVLHSFCILSFFYVRIYCVFHPLKKILTKCGGPDPKGYFPLADELILYSQENFKYFSGLRKFANSKKYYIPNRVSEPVTDRQRIDDLRSILKLNGNERVFLRIGRFHKHYEKTIYQSVNLVKELNKNNFPCILILLGSIQDTDLVKKLEDTPDPNVRIVTDGKFTANSSELIDIAEFIIGTGRSLMEASSKGKVLLTSNSNGYYPILVDKVNFKILSNTNFSPRNLASGEKDGNFNSILEFLQNGSELDTYKYFSKTLFKDYFDISNVLNIYISLYSKLSISFEKYYYDTLLHYFFVFHKVRVRKGK